MNVKSILLGCAGSLFVFTAAQAASPVEYVKICSLYGAGFYYIPGTDMCIKIGGYMRAQSEWNSQNGVVSGNSNPIQGPNTIPEGRFDRSASNLAFTQRGAINIDTRTQTAYGTVRGYLSIGAQTFSAETNSTFFADRAFIQFAGFTAGRTQSFFDIFTTTEQFTYTDSRTSGDTYNYGQFLFGYTANFGNGISASISAEAPRRIGTGGVVDGSLGGFGVNGAVTTDTAGFQMPDIVANLRIDQSWGYVGVSGALHQVAGNYWGSGDKLTHPDNQYGWAAQLGGMFNLPGGDKLGASIVDTRGAVGYATKAGSWQIFSHNGQSAGVGWVADGIFDNVLSGGPNLTQIQMTNAWSVNAGYEHFWNPWWRTSLYGGFTRVTYDQTARNIAAEHLPSPPAGGLACGQPVEGAVWPPVDVGTGAGNSCSPNFSFWQVGSRTQWNVTKDLYVGADVTYTQLNSAYKGPLPAGVVAIYPPATVVENQSFVSGILRVQYNFASGNEGPNFAFAQ